MNIDPKGRIPETGMMNQGDEYHFGAGIGLGMLLTRQGNSTLPTKCLPKMVPTTVSGKETKSQTAIIFMITIAGIAFTVS
mmetsp:Transcript_4181/g.6456  ORF Transcript_4181/g.6456 Transcript_4181/m.6456 type:complete len:80 (-) Transcript_4181:1306-1545(-)